MAEKTFYVTTPIYYVNDKPHIGHAYTTIAADVLARFKRLEGYRVAFLTGTDEHGQKVAKAAQNADVTPQAFVDEVSQAFRHLAQVLNVTHDDFIRTTEPRHIKAAQAIWQRLIERDEIYLGGYSGWYAMRDEAFYQESELVNGKAPTGAEVEWLTEPSYFFRLSKWQEPLLKFYHDNPDFIGPEARRNEVLRFVEGGLTDLSVSRTSFSWGVPIPGDTQHVMYVWLDALTNYLTAAGFPESLDQELWAESLHVVGKDILRFHAVYWPAFLLAAGIQPPKRVYAHGWWTNEGEKISKSLGNAIDPLALIEKYGLDPVRYFMMREVPFGQDGDFSHTALIGRLNADLANSYGNLCQRVLSFVAKNLGGQVPQPSSYTSEDQDLLAQGEKLMSLVHQELDKQAIHKALEHLWRVVGEANRYVDEQKPWSLKTTDPERLGTILYVLMDVIRRVTLLLQPFIPQSAEKMLAQLGINDTTFATWDDMLVPQAQLPTPQPLFPRWVEAA